MIKRWIKTYKLIRAKSNLVRTLKELNSAQKHYDNIGTRLIYLGLANQYKREIRELEKELK